MSKKIKILCLSRAPLDFFGGIPSTCLNLYKDIDLDVTCYSYSIKNNFKNKIKRKFGNINEFVFPSEIILGTFAISLRYFLHILFDNNKYKYIHLQHPDPFSSLAVLIKKIFHPKINILITWHAEIYKTYYLLSPFLLFLDFFIFFFAKKIIYFTPYHVKDSILAKLPFVLKKITIIPYCLDNKLLESFYLPKPANKNLKEKKFINILSIGRLVKYKGYEYAIKSLLRLNKNFNYYIVGDGPLKRELKILINDLNLKDKVFLLGEVTDKEKYKRLNEADIFLFPSITSSEAYGLVQLEAMCFMLPIVNTFLNNGVNYLVPPEVAITCKPKDIKDLTKSLNSLLEDENLYIKKTKKIKKNLERFSLSDMKKKYLEIFES